MHNIHYKVTIIILRGMQIQNVFRYIAYINVSIMQCLYSISKALLLLLEYIDSSILVTSRIINITIGVGIPCISQ